MTIEYFYVDFHGDPPGFGDLEALLRNNWETFSVVYVPRVDRSDFWRAYMRREKK